MLHSDLTFAQHVQQLQQLLRNESFITEFEKTLIQNGATDPQLEAFNALKELFPCCSPATPLIQPPIDYLKVEKKLLKLFGLKSFLKDISETIAFAERQYERKTGKKLVLFNETRDEIINIQQLSATLFSQDFEKAYIDAGMPQDIHISEGDEIMSISCYHYPNSNLNLKMIPLLAFLPVLAIGFTVLGVISLSYWNSDDWKGVLASFGLLFLILAGISALIGTNFLLRTWINRGDKKDIHKNLSTKREKILQAFRPPRSVNGYSVMLEAFLSHHLSIIDILQSMIDQRTGPGNPLNNELPQDIKYLLFLKLYLKEVNRQQIHFRRTKNARYAQCEQIV